MCKQNYQSGFADLQNKLLAVTYWYEDLSKHVVPLALCVCVCECGRGVTKKKFVRNGSFSTFLIFICQQLLCLLTQ